MKFVRVPTFSVCMSENAALSCGMELAKDSVVLAPCLVLVLHRVLVLNRVAVCLACALRRRMVVRSGVERRDWLFL